MPDKLETLPQFSSEDKVWMVDKQGNDYTVPGHMVQDALTNGYSIPQEYLNAYEKQNAEKLAVEQRNANPKYEHPSIAPGSDINTYATKFLNTATLGVAPIIEKALSKEQTPEEKALLEKQMAATEQEHPYLSSLATGAGFAGSLLIPGPLKAGQIAKEMVLGIGEKALAEGAASKLVAPVVEQTAKEVAHTSFMQKMAASAAQGAAMNEAYAAPSQLANLAIGDPEQAAESMLWNVGLGSVLGVGGEFSSAALRKIGEGMRNLAPRVENLADDMTLKQLNLNKDKINPYSREAVLNFMKDHRTDIGDQLSNTDKLDLLDEHGERIGAFEDDSLRNYLNNKQIKIGDNPALDKIVASNPYRGADTSGVHQFGFNPIKLAVKLEEMYDQENPDILGSPLHPAVGKTLKDAAEHILQFVEKRGDQASLSFDQLKDLTSSLKGKAFIKFNTTLDDAEKNQVIQWVTGKLSSAKERMIDEMYVANDDPNKLVLYQKAKRAYQATKIMLDPKLQLPERVLQGMEPSALTEHHAIIAAGMGLATGHFAGGGIAAGMMLRPLATNIARKTILPIMIRKLYAAAESSPETFGPILAKTLSEAADKHITDTVPSLFEKARSGFKANLKPSATVPTAYGTDALNSFLGSSGKGKSEDEKFAMVHNALVDGIANPDSIAENVGSIASMFGMTPDLQRLVSQKQFDAIEFLNSKLPQNPHPNLPFSDNDWSPTDAQKQQFLKILAIVENPMIAVHKLADPNASLSNDEIEALKTVFPALYNKLTGEVVKAAYAPGASKTHNNVKNKVSRFIGGEADRSLDVINGSRTQKTYQLPMQKESGNKMKAPKSNSMMTSVQRRANK